MEPNSPPPAPNLVWRHLRPAPIGLGILLSTWSLAGSNRWTTTGPEDPAVKAVAVDPRRSSSVFAVTTGGFVFHSVDAGRGWKKLAYLGSPQTAFDDLLIDPQSSATLYVATTNGVLRSQDAGLSWKALSNGLPDSRAYEFVAAPAAGSLYVRLDAGLYRTANGGENWESVFPGYVETVAIDPEDPRRIYIGSEIGALSSKDGGQNWSLLQGLQGSVYRILVRPDDPSVLYAVAGERNGGALYKSHDRGASWIALYSGITFSIALDSAPSPHLYAATPGSQYLERHGVLLREDRPELLTVVSSLPFCCASLTTNPSDASVIYLKGYGFYKSVDSGMSWSRAVSGMADSAVPNLAIDPQVPSTVYSRTLTSYTELFRSRDAGRSWEVAGEYRDGMGTIAVDPSDSNLILVGDYGGLARSLDGGATWLRVPDFPIYYFPSVLFDSTHPATVYASADGYLGIYRSADRGETWRSIGISSGIGSPDIGGYLALAPTEPPSLYAATFNGLYRFNEIPSRWDRIAQISSLTAIATDPKDPSTIYLGSQDGFFFKSSNQGQTWKKSLVFGTATAITSIVVDPVNPSRVYVSCEQGIARSLDGGSSWQELNDGLDSRLVYQLVIDPSGQILHAATATGVYDYTICPFRRERSFEPCSRTVTVPSR